MGETTVTVARRRTGGGREEDGGAALTFARVRAAASPRPSLRILINERAACFGEGRAGQRSRRRSSARNSASKIHLFSRKDFKGCAPVTFSRRARACERSNVSTLRVCRARLENYSSVVVSMESKMQ